MGFGDFLKKIATPVATVVGGPVAGAVVGGITNYLGGRSQANAQRQGANQAAQTAMSGFNYLNQSPIVQQYLPAGGAAMDQQAALLGLSGDPGAARAAYGDFLNSTGYQSQLRAGQQAITGSAAAAGLLGSGSTLKALQRYGSQLGQQSFDNYLGHLGRTAGMGLQAGGMLGQAATAGGLQGSQYQYDAAMQAANTKRNALDSLLGGLGSAVSGYLGGRGGGGIPMPQEAVPGYA